MSGRISFAKESFWPRCKVHHWWSVGTVALNFSQIPCSDCPSDRSSGQRYSGAYRVSVTEIWNLRRARNTRQLAIFPLATTTVGWVPDRTPGGPKRKRRTRSEAESCAGGLPTDDRAKGEPQPKTDRQGARCTLSTCLQPLSP